MLLRINLNKASSEDEVEVKSDSRSSCLDWPGCGKKNTCLIFSLVCFTQIHALLIQNTPWNERWTPGLSIYIFLFDISSVILKKKEYHFYRGIYYFITPAAVLSLLKEWGGNQVFHELYLLWPNLLNPKNMQIMNVKQIIKCYYYLLYWKALTVEQMDKQNLTDLFKSIQKRTFLYIIFVRSLVDGQIIVIKAI